MLLYNSVARALFSKGGYHLMKLGTKFLINAKFIAYKIFH